ncbi:MAG: hypothetical protein AAGD25_05700 [Cyanobacteria bacterium P01_F01_bin.150]
MMDRAKILKQTFTLSLELPFLNLLCQFEIEQVLMAEGVQYHNYVIPIVTLWAFFS